MPSRSSRWTRRNVGSRESGGRYLWNRRRTTCWSPSYRHAGRLVTKRELLDLVWPESFVGDGILTVHISNLRKALGEGAHGREDIETVPRSGYRFVGAVTKQEPNRDDASERCSLAVLPARPLTTEILSERDRNLGLAISDVLIDRLGAITQLVVRPARAVHMYTRGGEDPAVVGRSCVSTR